MFGSENASRYAGAKRLEILLEVIARIPNVTSALQDSDELNLLPPSLRLPRPTREHGGRRRRG